MSMLYLWLPLLLIKVLSVDGDNTTFTYLPYSHVYERRSIVGTAGYRMPYTGTIPGPINDGKEIIIEGVPTSRATRMTFEVCDTTNCRANVPLHVQFRFNTVVTSVSSKANNVWGREQILQRNDAQRGRKFELKIIIYQNKFTVLIDNKRVLEPTNLQSLNNVKYIQIRDQVTVNWIYYSTNFPSMPLLTTRPSHGKIIIIRGRPTNGVKFAIAVECKRDLINDVALLFEAVLSTGQEEVLINHRVNEAWDTNSQCCCNDIFPFANNREFRMKLAMKEPTANILVDENTEYQKTDLIACTEAYIVWTNVTVTQIIMT
ncbi:32 kDa beta-galactoside-binding lectin lec-3-like [Physella acuta]|uniref:32 kDa beta-galactoside-binding lectin lec-3-like n=1 Tax=Physella acuta TaxID=109671 RepID=UPI0027DE987B|nr:32 kDa beta-galactoside-binding lectin lec-3-like [Physella acuta]XP_059174788.1 32 kDa beta-galactoside-binding lectin lec-3-like [Physella acuta]